MGVPTGMKEENIKAFFIFVIAWFLISMITHINSVYIYSYSSVTVQSLSHVQFFVTPWTAACQDSLSITKSQSLLNLMSREWNSYPPQYSGLEISMDCRVHGVAKSWTLLSDFHFPAVCSAVGMLVGDAIQPSHPLSSPSPPTFNLSQHQGLFQ